MSCPLCNLEKKTLWFYEHKNWVICDCLTCAVPMLVWREHTMTVGWWEVQQGLNYLLRAAERRWEDTLHIKFRFHQRQIPDHFHVHAERIEL